MLKRTAEIVTEYLSHTVVIIAAFVIAIALIKFLYKYVLLLIYSDDSNSLQALRIKFGSALTLSLELLLAADILTTAVAPTWNDIGKLAAIAVLRTGLNYFLERELRKNEDKGV